MGPNDGRLIDLFQSSDIFVLPSLAETFGIAAVEASAVGLPVVASRVGGLTDIVVDGETGLTVPPRDAQSLGHALRTLADSHEVRRQLGVAARLRAEQHFDAYANARQLFELVHSCAPRSA